MELNVLGGMGGGDGEVVFIVFVFGCDVKIRLLWWFFGVEVFMKVVISLEVCCVVLSCFSGILGCGNKSVN